MSPPHRDAWYRQGWPWFLLLLPATVVVASFLTLWIAITNPQSEAHGDYYRDGLALNRHLEQSEVARGRGLHAELRYERANGTVTIDVAPDDALPASLSLTLLHPTNAALDGTLSLVRTSGSRFTARLAPAPAGKRYLQLTGTSADAPWVLVGILGTDPVESTTLRPAAG